MSEYLLALAILLSNLGGKYLPNEIEKHDIEDNEHPITKKLFDNYIMRKVVLFFMAYMMTKDFWVSFMIVILFVLFCNTIHNIV